MTSMHIFTGAVGKKTVRIERAGKKERFVNETAKKKLTDVRKDRVTKFSKKRK